MRAGKAPPKAWPDFACRRHVREFVEIKVGSDRISKQQDRSFRAISHVGYTVRVVFLDRKGMSVVSYRDYIGDGDPPARGDVLFFRAYTEAIHAAMTGRGPMPEVQEPLPET